MFVWFLAIVLLFVTMYSLFCYISLQRKVPVNFILLGVFTVCEAYMVTGMTAFIRPRIVLEAALLTAGITIALTIFAFTTKIDATKWGGAVFCYLFVPTLVIQLILVVIFGNTSWVMILISSVLAVVYGFYIIIDTQMLLDKKAYSLTVDDYIFGAMSLYIDIVGLFVQLLAILNETS